MPTRGLTGGCGLAIFLGFSLPSLCSAQTSILTPHHAVYNVSLGHGKVGSSVRNISGTITYDFNGAACNGFLTEFTLSANIQEMDGRTIAVQIDSSNQETGDGKSMTFHTRSTNNGTIVGDFVGSAEIRPGSSGVNTVVQLRRPRFRTIQFPSALTFPTAHMESILAAAQSGIKKALASTYDGSDPADLAYRTHTSIGTMVAGTDNVPPKAEGTLESLKVFNHWPITVSYFPLERTSDAAADHIVAFDLYQNGMSGSLHFDYGDFSIVGRLTSWTALPPMKCPN